MKKTILVLLMFALALAAAPVGSDADKQDVLAAMDSLKNAMIHKDGATLDKLLGSDLSYVHSTGQYETKTEMMTAITTGKTIIERVEYSGTSVRFHGNTALVRANVDLWHSPTNIVHMNVLHVWEKSPQGWILVARQATRLTK